MPIKYTENSKWNIMGMPPILFLSFSIVVIVAAYLDQLPNTLFGGLAFCAVMGYAMKFVVEHVSILKKTIGLAAVSFSCAILVYFHFIPESTVKIVGNVITGNCDFLSFYVGALLCGSIIGMDRKLLVKAGVRYFIPVLGGMIFAYTASAFVGSLLGYSWKDVVLYITGPIMGGGNGAGAVPMSEIYAAASGEASDAIYSRLLPAVTLGNWTAIFAAIGVRCIGEKFPKLSGNGSLMQGYTAEQSNTVYPYTMQLLDLGIGFFATAAFFIFGRIAGMLVPTIHAYAFTIIAVATVKIAGILPEKIEFCIVKWYQFISGNFTVLIMAGVGISMFNLATLLETLSPIFVVLCIVTVFMAVLGAGIFGLLVKFFFVESSITAGLCMCNAGGNGDIMVLSAANLMDLMSFAQISSRLGGAIILVLQSVLATALL
ncbi:MAG: 2-hydroxycarboxylate transporter family protein [Lachnospiraceae bacterium]|nr:2-hydroxycarboxylate transporter family protein [Lachnospiraceae bacterium]